MEGTGLSYATVKNLSLGRRIVRREKNKREASERLGRQWGEQGQFCGTEMAKGDLKNKIVLTFNLKLCVFP